MCNTCQLEKKYSLTKKQVLSVIKMFTAYRACSSSSWELTQDFDETVASMEKFLLECNELQLPHKEYEEHVEDEEEEEKDEENCEWSHCISKFDLQPLTLRVKIAPKEFSYEIKKAKIGKNEAAETSWKMSFSSVLMLGCRPLSVYLFSPELNVDMSVYGVRYIQRLARALVFYDEDMAQMNVFETKRFSSDWTSLLEAGVIYKITG